MKTLTCFPLLKIKEKNSYPILKDCHGIIECLELEQTFRDHLAPHSGSKQGHLHLDQDAQSPAQPAFECLCGRGLLCPSVPVSHHIGGKGN